MSTLEPRGVPVAPSRPLAARDHPDRPGLPDRAAVDAHLARQRAACVLGILGARAGSLPPSQTPIEPDHFLVLLRFQAQAFPLMASTVGGGV